MVNWSDPHEMAAEGDAFVKIIYCLFGLYVWEVFLTSGFEWAIIRGRRKIAWPLLTSFLVFFFLCRYCMLLAFIGLIISFSVKTKINCIALYTFISFAGNTTILGASTSLAIRTMALWEWRPLIISAIGALSLVHWGLLIRGMFIVRAQWSDQAQVCVVDYTNHTLLNVTFFYTMGFDCAIMVFTAVALGKRFRNAGLTGLLFRDGLVYFLISFTCNIFPAVLNVLNLNGKRSFNASLTSEYL
ncbi:hypothetical protein BV22DRAFT_1000822 [Leucogyrophana mollusca]|uniref:Uncharacterized protein n=1 Tax=Leucogyrophana mollusca TaxID=85980 RepID=A0ACB8BXS9_9AGAM|nr:hypothetical protein BV22DRAFT_1000822 [Leucogyrophana mollusca]